MRPMLLKCPSCQGNLSVAELDCPSCTLAIKGEFTLPALLRLAPAQLDFVEVFLKNRGVIRDVERELGISYPTVRARLDEVLAALGYQVRPSEPNTPDEASGQRRKILEDLKDGKITPEQARDALGGGRQAD
ncbi:MAG TPA: DUF2089 domain-containing protein [Candidatus Binataceae bacterium]|nr:DUF2089 domain-containing protein [Candidatus Binataceae bacterium]